MSRKELLEAFLPARDQATEAIKKIAPMKPHIEADLRRLIPEARRYAHYMKAQRRARARAVRLGLAAEHNLAMDAVSRIDEVGKHLLAWSVAGIKIKHARREVKPFKRELRLLHVLLLELKEECLPYFEYVTKVEEELGVDSVFLRSTKEILDWLLWARELETACMEACM